eukprot:CCRYP_017188-RB/>CCRYP_017188-RB protein AED:0.06 eAED:0.06 QI:316/1/1/1/0/0/4/1508/150
MSSAKQIILSPALRAAVHVHSSKLNPEAAKLAAAYLSSAPSGGKHVLPDLPYDYAALQPAISAETMELHHSKHHNTYVTNLNVALENSTRPSRPAMFPLSSPPGSAQIQRRRTRESHVVLGEFMSQGQCCIGIPLVGCIEGCGGGTVWKF